MNQFFIYFLQASIITSGLSISLGQFFLFLSLIAFFFKDKSGFKFSPIFFLSIGIFLLYFISAIYHFFQSGTSLVNKSSELKDIFLFFGFVLIQFTTIEEKQKLKKSIWILILLLTFTGLASALSPIRLSRYITDLFRESLNYKFSHSYGEIFNIKIHIPIGMMNTHLTFGGLLLLTFPTSFFILLTAKKKMIPLLVFLILLFIFFLNNARSAIIGSFASIAFGLFIYIFEKKKFSKRKIMIFLTSLGFIVLILFIGVKKVPVISKIIKPILGEEKHTDSGRTFIWHSSLELVKKNIMLGIGPGNFNQEIDSVRRSISSEKSELLFFNEISQKGHAHNDMLHLAVTSGIFTPIFFLLILGFIVSKLTDSRLEFKQRFFYFSLVGFFLAGSFQCYFQDDEVVILFWYLLGLLQSEEYTIMKNSNAE
jgi:O-antigen ligase